MDAHRLLPGGMRAARAETAISTKTPAADGRLPGAAMVVVRLSVLPINVGGTGRVVEARKLRLV
jgi:hypothetical protein